MHKRCYRNDIYPLYLIFKRKISLIFFIFPVFFSIFPQYPKTQCEADLAWRFFLLPSAMSILPITALIKHKIAAENHVLAIQVYDCYEFDTI